MQLSQLPPSALHFTCLDLKDAFFCIPLAPVSQPIFAFEWENPHTGTKTQLTWTQLPQGFQNSPTIFSEALAQDLKPFSKQHPNLVLLQYVDDLLLAGPGNYECREGMRALLWLLTSKGYQVSKRKAQICQKEVRYLGFRISQGQRTLGTERKAVIN